MPNAAISTLINNISTVTLDATAVNNYQDELYNELARLDKYVSPGVLIQTSAGFIAAVRGTAEYSLAAITNATARTALMIFYSDMQLAQVRWDEVQFFDPTWRSRLGTPVAFIQDAIDRVKFGVVPLPDHDGGSIIGLTPLSFTDWPDENITVIFAAVDTAFAGTNYADTHLAVAFEVIARELGRDSDHKDPDASTVAQSLADFFWRLSFPQEPL